jgi:predicted transcriptional regulator of viral defense system
MGYRYVKNGHFIRLKNNLYVLRQKWENFSEEDFFKTSNFLQIPSYISFMTALCHYEVSTQIQKDFFESASVKRSIEFDIESVSFNFHKLKTDHYSEFVKKGDFFIATKEKAFIDSVYLYSCGKYKIDFSSLNLEKLDSKELRRILEPFPERTEFIVKKLCEI